MLEVNQSTFVPVAMLGILLSQLACAIAVRVLLPTVDALDLESLVGRVVDAGYERNALARLPQRWE